MKRVLKSKWPWPDRDKCINSMPYSLDSFYPQRFPIVFKTYLHVSSLREFGPEQWPFICMQNISYGKPSDHDCYVNNTGSLHPHISAWNCLPVHSAIRAWLVAHCSWREAKRIGKSSQMLKTLSSGIVKLPGIFRSTYHFYEGQGWMCLKAFLFRGHLVFIIIAVTLCKRLVTVITFPQVPASHHSHAGDQNWNTLDIPLHLNLCHSSSGTEIQFSGSSRWKKDLLPTWYPGSI